MIVRNWDIALAICFTLMVAGVDNLSNELPQPENLTLSRNPDHFSVTAEWNEPPGLDADCKVNYTVELYYDKCPASSTQPSENTDKRQTVHLSHTGDVSNQLDICVVVRTNPMQCGNKTPSKAVYKSLSPSPALVKNFTCVYYSHMKMNCSWSVTSNVSDLPLFYKIENKDNPKPCMSYFTAGDMKTGCHLNDIPITAHNVFFRIGENGSPISNTFIIETRNSVKPEPPELNIIRKDESLLLNSSIPNFSVNCWKYKFTYSICNNKEEVKTLEEHFYQLQYDAACKYRARVQTIFTENCGEWAESEMSEAVYYGENTDLNSQFKVAMIVVPLMVSCCLIVALVLFRRYKDIILPTIPEPSLLFKDMLNSNNDGGQSKSLYVPITEVVERDIKLEANSTSLYPKP